MAEGFVKLQGEVAGLASSTSAARSDGNNGTIKEIKRVNQDDQCDFSCVAVLFKASSVAMFHLFSLIFKFDLQGEAKSISPVKEDRKVKNKTSYKTF